MSRSTGDGEILNIPLNHGMDESVDEHLAELGTFVEVRNMRVRANGLLEKRYGSPTLVATSINSSIPLMYATGTVQPSFLSKVGDVPIFGQSDGSIFALSDPPTSSEASMCYPLGRFSQAVPLKRRNAIVLNPTAKPNNAPSVAVNSSGHVMTAVCTGTSTSLSDPTLSTSQLKVYIETSEGVRVALQTIPGNVPKAKVTAFGTGFVLLYETYAGGVITIQTIAYTVSANGSITKGDVATLVSGIEVSTYWDISNNGTYGFLAYEAAGTVNLILLAFNASGASLGSTTVTNTANLTAPCVFADSRSPNYIWTAWTTDPGVTGQARYRVHTFNGSAFTAVVATQDINTDSTFVTAPMIGPIPNQPNRIFGTIGIVSSNPVRHSAAIFFHNVTGVSSFQTTIPQVFPMSKPDSQMRCWFYTSEVKSRNTYSAAAAAVADPLDTCRAALINFRRFGFLQPPTEPTDPTRLSFNSVFGTPELSSQQMLWFGPQGAGFFSEVAEGPHGEQYFSFLFGLSKSETQFLTRVESYSYSNADESPYRSVVPLEPSSVIGGGSPVEVYGSPQGLFFSSPTGAVAAPTGANGAFSQIVGAAEVGFLSRPNIARSYIRDGVTTSSATGLTAGGLYQYRALYQWADVYGRRHRSAPSDVVQLTPTGTFFRNAQLDIEAIGVTQRIGSGVCEPEIQLYRTVANGVEFHRIPTQFSAQAYSNGYVTYVDAVPDSVIEDEEFLYTDGGVLPNQLAPSCRFMWRTEDRLWCGGLWDSNIVECSKTIFPGEPVQFTNDASHQVDAGMAVTGGAYLDGQCILFGKDQIRIFSGDGPNDQGIGFFTPARIYASDIGCEDHRSIVETKIGVLFKSKRGFYLIPRGFAPPVFIGAQVIAQTTDMPDVLGAAVYEGNGDHLVRFLVADSGETDTRYVLTFDVERGFWFKDQYAATQKLAAIGTWPNGFVLARSDWQTGSGANAVSRKPFHYEDGSTYTDNANQDIEQYFNTAQILPFGPNGFGLVKTITIGMLVTGSAAVDVEISASIDGSTESTHVHAKTWNISPSAAVQYRQLQLVNQRCTSVQFEVTATDSTEAGSRVKFVAASIETSGLGGGIRLMGPGERG